jgi:protein required for attachment to host cells
MTRHATQPIEMLRKLGDSYRHVEQEHERQPLQSATRRRLWHEMHGIEDHFERLLVEWVTEDNMRERWRAFLHGRASAPEQPRTSSPPLFKGHTDAGATIEIRPVSDGYDIIVDGARIDHGEVPWHLDPDMRGPVQIGEHACEESFDAPPAAVESLAEFVAGRAASPWRWARELLEDGLIDPDVALTPRGKRCLERSVPVKHPAPGPRNFCVVVADAARARVLLLDVEHDGGGTETSELIEVAEITNPVLRARNVDVLSDSGTGRRGGARTPLHSPPDHRDQHRRELVRHFAAQIAEEAAAIWSRYPSCQLVVVASPVMLGLLRPAIERKIGPTDRVEIHDLARDLTKLAGPKLHDQLAEAGLVPVRGRHPPLQPTPGLPS